MALQHDRHGNFVTYIVEPLRGTPTRTALKIALTSPWQINFSFSSFFLSSLRIVATSGTPRASPLNPVEITSCSAETMTAPTWHLGSFDFRETAKAIVRKYSSQSWK